MYVVLRSKETHYTNRRIFYETSKLHHNRSRYHIQNTQKLGNRPFELYVRNYGNILEYQSGKKNGFR